ncbi:MAG: hypothetical protein E7260_04950 [Lachnospiraceae bacterium]|nr:hypothetical protein [Lachnospiraceae bacterium]
MKSNEEFIAGIYEKAASYTEEKETKIIRVNFAARAMKVAAMFAVCLGLAGVGAMTLGNSGKTPQGGNEGIALSSEDNVPFAVPEPRILPELSYMDGEVESIDADHNVVFLRLRDMNMEETPASERALVVVRFAEGVELIDKLCTGMQIEVGGATFESGYLTVDGEYTLLLVTREQDFFVWSEKSEKYVRPDFISDENE